MLDEIKGLGMGGKKLFIITAFWLTFLFSVMVHAQEIKVLTENYPPFNYEHDGEVKGISSVVVQAIMDELDWKQEIEVLSWNRAHNLITNRPGYILFSMARSEKREDLFKWVGPLYKVTGYYYKKKGHLVKLEPFEEIKNNASVGVRQNSNPHHDLIDAGFKHIVPLETPESYYRGLYYDRVDLIITSPWNLPFRAKKFNLPVEAFECTDIKHATSELSIAFSKETPDEIIGQWQESLDKLRQNGELDRLMKEALEQVNRDYDVQFDLSVNE